MASGYAGFARVMTMMDLACDKLTTGADAARPLDVERGRSGRLCPAPTWVALPFE